MQSTTDPVHVMILDGVGYESRKREIESGSGSGGRDEGGEGGNGVLCRAGIVLVVE